MILKLVEAKSALLEAGAGLRLMFVSGSGPDGAQDGSRSKPSKRRIGDYYAYKGIAVNTILSLFRWT